ncbi:MAG: putative lipid II flippase FtsW [Alphaproteobacteria bacterium]|nr:putative lipid II flippase FtsW [Alphaproteobacteria bacterium]
MDKSFAPVPLSRTDRSVLGRWWWTVDRMMLFLVLILALFGVAMVATASPSVAQRIGLEDYHFLFRHLAFLVVSVVLILALSFVEPRMILRIFTILFILSVLAIIAVLFVGQEIKGATRWVHFLGVSVQPSEFLKPSFSVIAAWLVAKQQESMSGGGSDDEGKIGFHGFNITVLIYICLIALLLMQPDLGMSVVLTCIFAVQIFLAGLRFRYLAVLGGVGVGGLGLAYLFLDHVRGRIDCFIDPSSRDCEQVERSLDSFRNGGLFGTGPGQGEEKLLLPDAHADFIFSVLAEEMGAISTILVIGLFALILLRGIRRLMDNGDIFSVLAVGGLLTMFGVQAIVHMGSSVSLLPAKGMTLPFISYGGSSLLSTSMAFGIILALTRSKNRPSIAKYGLRMKRSVKHLQEEMVQAE